jgi:hypothetical protein
VNYVVNLWLFGDTADRTFSLFLAPSLPRRGFLSDSADR